MLIAKKLVRTKKHGLIHPGNVVLPIFLSDAEIAAGLKSGRIISTEQKDVVEKKQDEKPVEKPATEKKTTKTTEKKTTSTKKPGRPSMKGGS